MSASFNGHLEVVDMLLHHGARVDLQSKVYLSDAHIVHTLLFILTTVSVVPTLGAHVRGLWYLSCVSVCT